MTRSAVPTPNATRFRKIRQQLCRRGRPAGTELNASFTDKYTLKLANALEPS